MCVCVEGVEVVDHKSSQIQAQLATAVDLISSIDPVSEFFIPGFGVKRSINHPWSVWLSAEVTSLLLFFSPVHPRAHSAMSIRRVARNWGRLGSKDDAEALEGRHSRSLTRSLRSPYFTSEEISSIASLMISGFLLKMDAQHSQNVKVRILGLKKPLLEFPSWLSSNEPDSYP